LSVNHILEQALDGAKIFYVVVIAVAFVCLTYFPTKGIPP